MRALLEDARVDEWEAGFGEKSRPYVNHIPTLTREELRAPLIQIAVYCGVPAGVEAFRIAREVLAAAAAG